MNFERFTRHGWTASAADDKYWTVYDSTFKSYLTCFSKGANSGLLLEQINTLRQKPRPVIIDLMSSPAALRSLYEPPFDFNGLSGLAVGISDRRCNATRELDENLGISTVHGDLKSSETWNQITIWLKRRKADLIIERGYGGLCYVPTYLPYYKVVISRLWNMLSENGGMMALLTPPKSRLKKRGIMIDEWIAHFNKRGIFVAFQSLPRTNDDFTPYGMLIMKKQRNEQL